RLSAEHLEQETSSPAGRVFLLFGGAEARAHDAALAAAALADAHTAERGSRELAIVLRKTERRLHAAARPAAREAEGRNDRIRIQDAAGVHAPVGIPDALEVAERFDELRPVHPGKELRARLAVAVFPGERSAVGEDEVGGFVEVGAETGDASARLEIE